MPLHCWHSRSVLLSEDLFEPDPELEPDPEPDFELDPEPDLELDPEPDTGRYFFLLDFVFLCILKRVSFVLLTYPLSFLLNLDLEIFFEPSLGL